MFLCAQDVRACEVIMGRKLERGDVAGVLGLGNEEGGEGRGDSF